MVYESKDGEREGDTRECCWDLASAVSLKKLPTILQWSPLRATIIRHFSLVWTRARCMTKWSLPSPGGGGGGLRPCRAMVPPHRVCRVTRGRRYVVLCEGDRHLCHLCRLCRLCHHDTEGGGGGHWKVCRGTCRDMGKLQCSNGACVGSIILHGARSMILQDKMARCHRNGFQF